MHKFDDVSYSPNALEIAHLSMRAVNKSTHYLLSLEPVKRSGRRHVAATHGFTRVRSPLTREAPVRREGVVTSATSQ